MIREADLLSYIPDFLKEYEEMKVLQQVMNPEVQEMEEETQRLFANQFIADADSRSIRRYEEMLGMQHFSSESLEERRFKILSKWIRTIPYTRNVLKKRLDLLCGEEGYLLEVEPWKKIAVRVALKNKSSFLEVKELLEEFVPCNMVIELQLLYNKHETLKRFTHQQLSARSHGQIRNEVLDNE